MEYSVKQLADLAGVSRRTLHYYDQLGLLSPSSVASNSYRKYDQQALLRLQQILFFKELGLSLREIKAIVDAPDFDILPALEKHRQQLKGQITRFKKLESTVDKTIRHLQGDIDMDDKELFGGFSDKKQKQYEKQIEAEFGADNPHVQQSQRRWKRYSANEKQAINQEWTSLLQDLAASYELGAESPQAQKVVARYHAQVNKFWDCPPKAFEMLASWQVTSPDFVKMFQSLHPEMPKFFLAAVRQYVNSQ